MISILAILAVTTSGALGVIIDDFSCTSGGVYTAGATACSNTYSDQACQAIYKESAAGVGYPAAGNAVQRPFTCYSTSTTGGSINQDLRKTAIANCAKTCGFCCATPAYNCSNVQFPRLNCNTILPSQCTNPVYRDIIAQDCPSACGFCNQGTCVDAVPECEAYMCSNIGLQDFVNQNCKKTCARCDATPSNPSTPLCTTYPPDTQTTCAAWAANGFCKNDFYKNVWRQYCATTCKIC
uniref:ShKT domain-containing protein n=1 Tax=Caenorhabditis tropicalis TaxID=1561998 RepID=A0A1I7U9S1_9PELO